MTLPAVAGNHRYATSGNDAGAWCLELTEVMEMRNSFTWNCWKPVFQMPHAGPVIICVECPANEIGVNVLNTYGKIIDIV